MSRFFVPSSQINGEILNICGSDVNHIKNVLRKLPGDKVICFDSSGKEYTSIIKEISQGSIILTVSSVKQLETESKIKINLGQCLPKMSKMDEIIQKSTELGVSTISPILSERSVAKGEKTDRWQKIASESAEQSGRYLIPEIKPLMTFDEFINDKTTYDIKIIAWECETGNTIKNIIAPFVKTHCNASLRSGISISIIIGPEGGFSSNEIDKAKSHGYIPVSLGKRILRTETAGPAVIAMIMYELEIQ